MVHNIGQVVSDFLVSFLGVRNILKKNINPCYSSKKRINAGLREFFSSKLNLYKISHKTPQFDITKSTGNSKTTCQYPRFSGMKHEKCYILMQAFGRLL